MRAGNAHPAPPPDYLPDTPLPQLLNALNVELVDSSIQDATFFGALVEHRDGSACCRCR
jgi:hypothetical protein